ncbi:hypothetical protein [Kribbella soli]|uniref:Uncharacterized protein n=1 Tax=Kribbella soli TaxID=1124743 RepID=A0A4R0HNN1_9ACTN|nr:hypothetical protein [Kribbella soli]TCC11614.1 hypothetical protein E0H45_10240 [Kribbella soli]
MKTKPWLWPANAVGMLVIVVAAILQPVTMLSMPCDEPTCDPHGYVAIFSVFPTAFVVIVALVALGLLNGRRRSGFGVAIGAAALCAGMLVLFGEILIAAVRWPLGVVTLVVAGLAIAGLRSAPVPARR